MRRALLQAAAEEGVARDVVGLHALGEHLAEDGHGPAQLASLGARVEQRGVRDDVGREPGALHVRKHAEGAARTGELAGAPARVDECREGDRVGRDARLFHALEPLERLVGARAARAHVDHDRVGAHLRGMGGEGEGRGRGRGRSRGRGSGSGSWSAEPATCVAVLQRSKQATGGASGSRSDSRAARSP